MLQSAKSFSLRQDAPLSTRWRFSNLPWASFRKPSKVICLAYFAAAAATDSHPPIHPLAGRPAHLPNPALAKNRWCWSSVGDAECFEGRPRPEGMAAHETANRCSSGWRERELHLMDLPPPRPLGRAPPGKDKKCNAVALWLALASELSCRPGRTWRRRSSMRWTWVRIEGLLP